LTDPAKVYRPAWAATGLVLAAYLLLILAWSGPLLGQLTETSIGTAAADKQMHYWDLWWSHKGLTEEGRSFLYSDFIYYPPGVSLWRSNAGFLLFLTAMLPMAVVPDLDLAFNFIALLGLFISCVGGYLLGVRLFQHRGVAFFLGLIVAFNPFTLFHLNIGLFEVANLGWAMIYIGALERLLEQRNLRSAAWAALCYMVAAAWCWYVGYLMLLFTALFLLVRLNPRALLGPQRRFLLPLGLFGALVGAFLLVVSLQMGLGAMSGGIQNVEDQVVKAMAGKKTKVPGRGETDENCLANLAGVKNEGALESLELKLMASLDLGSSLDPYNEEIHMANISLVRWIVPLLLAMLAVFLRRGRAALLYGILSLGAVVVALGPCLVINEEVMWSSCGWTPYALLAKVVPGFSRAHFPLRLLLLSVIGVAILAGYGLKLLLQKAGDRVWLRRLIFACAVPLSLLGSVGMLGLPPESEKADVPKIYETLAQEPGDFALLEIPFFSGSQVLGFYRPSLYAYYQSVHGKRLIYGSIPHHLAPSDRPAAVANNALISRVRKLLRMSIKEGAGPNPPAKAIRKGIADLAAVGVRYIVLHRDQVEQENSEAIHHLLSTYLGKPTRDESAEGDIVLLFKVPAPETR